MTIGHVTHRLSLRHAIISVLAAAVLGLVMTFASLAFDLAQERDRISATVAETGRAMLGPATRATFVLDPALAESIVVGLVNNGIFANARIYDDHGRVLAEVGGPSSAHVGLAGRLLLRDLHGIRVPLIVERPNPVSGALEKLVVGRLMADLDDGAILARLLDRAGTMLLFGLTQTLLLGVVLVVVYQFLLSRPILALAEDVRKVDPREPAATLLRVPRGHERTELGFLVGKTNALLRQFAATLRRGERIQDELRRERAHLDSIMESVIDAIITTNSDLRVQRINHAAVRLFGYEQAELRGLPMSHLFAPEDWSVVESAFRAASSDPSPEEGDHQEVTARDRDGRSIPVSIGVSRMKFASGRNFVCVVRDITARKLSKRRLAEALREAEEANRAKSQFLATMSHELRTPLNAIIGFSDMIRGELLGPVGVPAYREYARDISESGTHLLAIINDILDISKIEAGQARIEPEWLDAGQLIAGCVGLLQHQAEAAGVRVTQEVEPGCPALYADSRSLKQIVINLMSNAIKFTPSGGRVRISIGPGADGGVRIAVADTGIGIAEEDLARIWRPFEQVENALSRRKGGTGLGLPLVKRLADLHGAEITIESRLGEGTIVGIEFPCAAIPERGRGGALTVSGR